jgi:hypothetical protein
MAAFHNWMVIRHPDEFMLAEDEDRDFEELYRQGTAILDRPAAILMLNGFLPGRLAPGPASQAAGARKAAYGPLMGKRERPAATLQIASSRARKMSPWCPPAAFSGDIASHKLLML